MLTGGCFCGEVRYQITGAPFHATICHCVDCRRLTAAPMVAWFSVTPSDFAVVKGTPQRFASSANVSRCFCPRCGTPLTYQHDNYPDEIDVATGTLDDPSAVPPQDHVQAASRLAWVQIDDGLPQYPGRRTG
jgi:hypothetical protein